MRRSIVAVALVAGAGVLGVHSGASAQQLPESFAQQVPLGEVPKAASPSGARYIPGVGFRFVTPPGVYGYRAPARVYAYRAYRRGCSRHDWWGWDRCRRW